MGLILDSNFIIAAEREARRAMPGAADAFLAAHPTESFVITFTVAGELACGRSAVARAAWQKLFQCFEVLPWSLEVSWQYGEIYRQLQRGGFAHWHQRSLDRRHRARSRHGRGDE